MEIDKGKFFDAIWDLVQEEAATVFCLGWDGDFPGGSGAVRASVSPVGEACGLSTASVLFQPRV